MWACCGRYREIKQELSSKLLLANKLSQHQKIPCKMSWEITHQQSELAANPINYSSNFLGKMYSLMKQCQDYFRDNQLLSDWVLDPCYRRSSFLGLQTWTNSMTRLLIIPRGRHSNVNLLNGYDVKMTIKSLGSDYIQWSELPPTMVCLHWVMINNTSRYCVHDLLNIQI